MGRFMCLIEPDGFVYPCGQLIGKFPALNIREAGFKKAWENLLQKEHARHAIVYVLPNLTSFFALMPSVVFNYNAFLKGIIKK